VFGPNERAANKATIFIKYDGTTQTLMPGVFTSKWKYKG
jgi:branched-chain amino acid transport system substrate-binding protein